MVFICGDDDFAFVVGDGEEVAVFSLLHFFIGEGQGYLDVAGICVKVSIVNASLSFWSPVSIEKQAIKLNRFNPRKSAAPAKIRVLLAI